MQLAVVSFVFIILLIPVSSFQTLVSEISGRSTFAKMKSWVTVNDESHFSIGNIPFGVFSTAGGAPRCASAIGNFAIDLGVLYQAGLFSDVGLKSNVFEHQELNAFMEHDRGVWRAVRQRIMNLLSDPALSNADSRLRENQNLQQSALIPLEKVQMHLPARITEYTDFYSSREHATNVGIMFRGVDNALQPNWLHLPVGYHGRASSVVVSGNDVKRPCGQLQKDPADPKAGSTFGACKSLDFELEIGAFLGGPPNPLGTPVRMEEAENRIFGVVLLNDWSARDIQAWEYVPLGPFTAKNFCTSISPWIVTLDALEPFRCQSSAGPVQDNPVPLDYLQDPDYARGTYDVKLFVSIIVALGCVDIFIFSPFFCSPQASITADGDSTDSLISESNFKYLYWNMKQQLVHHS
jgi:fumarylacetoacetase